MTAAYFLSLRKGGSFLRFVLPHTWGRPTYYYFYYYCYYYYSYPT